MRVLDQRPLDMDFLEFTCRQDLVFLNALSEQIEVPPQIFSGLVDILSMIEYEKELHQQPVILEEDKTGPGRPRLHLNEDRLLHLLGMQLPVPCIANLLGVSKRTVFRRMAECNVSVRGHYSTLSNEELDRLIIDIKTSMPNAGYRMVRGALKGIGHLVQWERVVASMHRVDTAGILSRLTQLGCVVRRTYSVPCPKFLFHIDTNHKLIRYNIVIFGGIDGFSRKIMYLGTANNNLASTTLRFFNQAVQQYGFPLRVRGDHGNDECGCCQVDVHSTGNRKGQLQYIAGKSVHNQRIERLWRDVWMGVTWTFYNLLHNLEEQGNLDISDSVHLFCCHYVFIPRLQTSLHVFCCGWDDHPLRSEGNMTPNQLWEVGQMQNPIPDPVGLEVSRR
uniref:Integrase core domain-containing protein n=1 Tax=Paramormyrops kingsleyae TaxID=1676925 RepID=A0A3B3SWA4_9TELE